MKRQNGSCLANLRIGFFALLNLFLVPYRGIALEGLNLPLTAEKIETFLRTDSEPTVEKFLQALPDSIKENFVLVHTSRSLHQATPTHPRQILFGSDARFLIGVGGIESDPRYNTIEFAEFNPDLGNYEFGTLDFENGHASVNRNVPFCNNCHGRPAKPLWEQYPKWVGAYGDAHGKVDSVLQSDFNSFVNSTLKTDRYIHLRLGKGHESGTFTLPTRYYPYANTDFNHELGNTVALGTMTRLKNSPAYPQWRWAALASNSSLSCIDTDVWYELGKKVNSAYAVTASLFAPTKRLDYKVMRLLGIEPETELSLEKIGNKPGVGSSWQTGAYRTEEAIALQLVVDLTSQDDELKKLFSTEQTTINQIYRYSRLVGDERARELKKSSSWFLFFDVFDPILENKGRQRKICERLNQLTP